MEPSRPNILIEVSHKELQTLLSKQIKESPVKAELLMLFDATLNEDYQKLNLYKTLVGIDITPTVKVGEKYWVESYQLSSWNFSREEMQKQHMIVENFVLCVISKIDKYAQRPIEMEYLYIDGAGKKTFGKTEIAIKELRKQEVSVRF